MKSGGKLHRVYPGLTKTSKPAKSPSRNDELFEAASQVRLLEEDTIVQLDPSRAEKVSVGIVRDLYFQLGTSRSREKK